MRIFIDAQILQTSDAQRGMGLYLSSVLRSIGRRDERLDIVAITNPLLPQESQAQALLAELLPGVTLLSVRLHVRTASLETYKRYAQQNKAILEKAIEPLLGTKKEIIYFVPAFFANDIFSIFPTNKKIKKVLLFHDLIPYLYANAYFPSFSLASCIDYCERFAGLFEADAIVTNSQTTADDLEIYFGISKKRLFPILGSGADRSHLTPKKPKLKLTPDNFVLMPSGDDIRKNNTRGVEAFDQAVKELNKNTKLVITSRFSEGTKEHLSRLSDQVVFTGGVSDEEYLWLIRNASFVFFPTEYEGLGMPLIEAVSIDAPVVCSAISVFKEISADAFTYVNPLSVADMASALKTELRKTPSVNVKKYRNIEDRFNWENTANLFTEAMRAIAQLPDASQKLRLAVFAPSVDSYSAIGKYALETHGELAQVYDIDYYFERGQTQFSPTRLNILAHAATSYDASKFDAPTRYDAILYHIGNSEFHINTIYNSLRYPGTVVLHDCQLNGIFDYMENKGFMTSARHQAETILSKAYASKRSSHIVSIVTAAKSVICHSKYVQKAVTDVATIDPKKVHLIDHPIATPTIQFKRVDVNKTVASFAGIISTDKGIGLVDKIAAIDDSIEVRLFGFGVLGDQTISNRTNVTILKNLSDLEFQNNLRDTSILINYRMNYHGETSRSALEAMRYGAAVIVKDVGWFSELPGDTVLKVGDVSEIEPEIIRYMKKKPTLKPAEYTEAKLGFENYVQKIKEAIR